MHITDVKFDCRHFKGYVPCTPHKEKGVVCTDCPAYDPVRRRILIIKLGAMGDVIRTTPLLVRLRKEYPDAQIHWITHTPDILPAGKIDRIYPWNETSLHILKALDFDIAVNLDKDLEACILLRQVKARRKFGFIEHEGHVWPLSPAAEHKILTGLFDDLSKANTRHYIAETFDICGFDFQDEPYLLDVDAALREKWRGIYREKTGDGPYVGLNTGCGARWPTRLWPEEYWVELIQRMQRAHLSPILLGGPDEDARNRRLHQATGAFYPGTFSLKEFIAMIAATDAVVTAVTMAMHLAIGTRRRMVLFNNIFNRHEFYLYGRGVIVEPDTGCDCYYGQTCRRPRHCMRDLPVDKVWNALQEVLALPQ